MIEQKNATIPIQDGVQAIKRVSSCVVDMLPWH